MNIRTRIDNHDPDIVQDGETVHVSMMMRDGLSPLQRAVMDGRVATVASFTPATVSVRAM
jgi:hypothetical protein